MPSNIHMYNSGLTGWYWNVKAFNWGVGGIGTTLYLYDSTVAGGFRGGSGTKCM